MLDERPQEIKAGIGIAIAQTWWEQGELASGVLENIFIGPGAVHPVADEEIIAIEVVHQARSVAEQLADRNIAAIGHDGYRHVAEQFVVELEVAFLYQAQHQGARKHFRDTGHAVAVVGHSQLAIPRVAISRRSREQFAFRSSYCRRYAQQAGGGELKTPQQLLGEFFLQGINDAYPNAERFALLALAIIGDNGEAVFALVLAGRGAL